jgi:hypothetical protein
MRHFASAVVCATLLVITGCKKPQTGPVIDTTAPKASAPTFLAGVHPGIPQTLDLSDPAQHRFLEGELDKTPFTAAATPQLHKVLDAMGQAPTAARTLRQMNPPPENQPVDLLDVVNASVDEAGNLQATGIASAVGRSSFVHAVLRLVDADSGTALGAPAYTSSFTGVDARMTATGKLAHPGQRARAVITAIFTPYACPAEAIDCVPRPGLTGNAAVPALTAQVSGAPYAQVMVQPIVGLGEVASAGASISPANPPQPTAPILPLDAGVSDASVLICLGRMPGSQPGLCNPDGGPSCTYCDPTQGATATPLLRLPISGTVNLRYPAAPTPAISGFSSYMVPQTGGACRQYNTTSSPTAFTSLNGGMTVRWNYGQTNFDSTSWAQYGQLTSGSSCWTANGEAIQFTFQFTITDQQGNLVPITIANFGQPNPNTAVVPPTQLAYGCLAAGTPVLLADGTSKPIEQVQVGDHVKSDAAGTARRVDLTYVGVEYIPMVRIAAGKHVVTVTAGHPLPTPDHRIVLARRVKVGDRLVTVEGPAAVTAVELVPPGPGEGVRVYNLDVGEARGKAPALTATNRTLFAAGILVGDNATQRDENQRVQLTAAAGGELPVPREWAAEYELSRKLAAR